METRINIYGGTNLSPELIRFVRSLTRCLLKFPDVVLISGGFDYYLKHPHRVSVDRAVLDEAKKTLGSDLMRHRFETWVPKQDLDRKDVLRFREGKVHEVDGTAQSRRFNLIQNIDGLVTIKGEGNTRCMLELALAIHRPALPIAYTGGDSKKIWAQYGNDLIKLLNLPGDLKRILKHVPQSDTEIDKLARKVGEFIRNVVEKKCLILMPFGGQHDDFYQNFLEPAIKNANYIPYRIDKNDPAGNIPALFISGLERARAIIVDITGMNANVLYELGYVHAKGINPFIIDRNKSGKYNEENLPFYLKQEMIVTGSNNMAGHKKIAGSLENYLKALAKNKDSLFAKRKTWTD